MVQIVSTMKPGRNSIGFKGKGAHGARLDFKAACAKADCMGLYKRAIHLSHSRYFGLNTYFTLRQIVARQGPARLKRYLDAVETRTSLWSKADEISYIRKARRRAASTISPKRKVREKFLALDDPIAQAPEKS